MRPYTGLLWLMLACAACAEEFVVRVVDIQNPSKKQPGVLYHRKPSDARFFEAFVGSNGRVAERFRTDPETVAALEFVIGGRVGINKDTEVEIIGDRSVSAVASPQRIILHQGAIWMKSNRLKRPLEIQSHGATMGIRGTEFIVEAAPERTEVSVLEGSVEIRDRQQKLLGMARPGDVYDVRESSFTLSQMDPEELRKLKEAGPLGEVMVLQLETQEATQKVSELKDRWALLNEKLNQLEKPDSSQFVLARPYKSAVGTGPRGGGVEGAEFAFNPESQPIFRWKGFQKADGYVVFLASDESFKEIVYSTRTRDALVVYPGSARPLGPGAYFWRVVPVDEHDEPLSGATQVRFVVPVPGS